MHCNKELLTQEYESLEKPQYTTHIPILQLHTAPYPNPQYVITINILSPLKYTTSVY